jgi:hypothetical protein
MRKILSSTNGKLFALLRPALFSFVLFLSCSNANAYCTGYDTTFINSTEVWDSVPTRFHGGVIFLRDGASLTINSSVHELHFHLNCGIANSDSPLTASHLVINNVMLVPCGGVGSTGTWAGIHMTGVRDGSGLYSEYGYNSTTHSITGQNSAQTTVSLSGTYVYQAEDGVYSTNHAIVQLYGVTFYDCHTGVRIADSFADHLFTVILTSSVPVTCVSYIRECEFNTHQLVGALSHQLYDYVGVNLYGTQYFAIMGNILECTKTPADSAFGRPTGIKAVNANFSCHSTTGTLDPVSGCISYSGTKIKNRFMYLTYGIHSEAPTINSTVHVDDCIFKDCFVAAYVKGGAHNVFHADSFGLKTSGSSYWDATAPTVFNNLVWLYHTTNFIFYGNVLKEDKKYTKFLYIDSCGTDQKNITKDSFFNTRTGSWSSSADKEYGIYFSGDNSNQFVTCNYFRKNLYGIYADSLAVLSNFGTSGAGGVGVGNIFDTMITVHLNYWVYHQGVTTLTPTSTQYCQNAIMGSLIVYSAGFRFYGTATDACSSIESCKSWSLGIDPVTGVGLTVNVYPNPAREELVFDLSDVPYSINKSTISICDALGRSIASYKIEGDEQTVHINTSAYANGMYIYKLVFGGSMEKTGKFEIRH